MPKSKQAKAKQAGLVNEDGSPKPEGRNSRQQPTPEIMKHHATLALVARAAHVQAVEDAKPAKANEKSALGAYRSAIKEAKKDGISEKSLTNAIAIHTADHKTEKMISEETRMILAAIGSPMAVIYTHQVDLFDATAAAPAAAHDGGDTSNSVHAAGAKARREDVPRGNNPEKFGSMEAVSWFLGWDEEDEFIAAKPKTDGPRLGQSSATAGTA